MKIKLVIGIIFAIGISITSFQFTQQEQVLDDQEDLNQITKTKLDIKSLFNIYGIDDNFEIENGKKVWNKVEFELIPENFEIYDELSYDYTEKIVVIYPVFTASAYDEPGFYTYFRGECDERCLTIQIKEYIPTGPASGNGFQVLNLLGYEMISDVQVDQNPEILKEYDKIILLHNEYVTKKEFDAIVNHPNVIYLYPNALYAEVSVNYEDKLITLLRGHNYPESQVVNGFNWEFDNSKFEYNTTCENIGFDRIDNGWMLNCYPESAIHKSKVLLEMIKQF